MTFEGSLTRTQVGYGPDRLPVDDGPCLAIVERQSCVEWAIVTYNESTGDWYDHSGALGLVARVIKWWRLGWIGSPENSDSVDGWTAVKEPSAAADRDEPPKKTVLSGWIDLDAVEQGYLKSLQDSQGFLYLSSYDDPTESVRAELVAVGIEPSATLDVQVTSNGSRSGGAEADGVLNGWNFRRHWRYWAADGSKLATAPMPVESHRSIRRQGDKDLYHIDTPAALRAFVEAVK